MCEYLKLDPYSLHIIIMILSLKISPDMVADIPSGSQVPPYLNLVCDVGDIKRVTTRVLVSQHRGYIFIQTDQPMYNPTQTGTEQMYSKLLDSIMF